jgi:hypothetical protein
MGFVIAKSAATTQSRSAYRFEIPRNYVAIRRAGRALTGEIQPIRVPPRFGRAAVETGFCRLRITT